MKRFILSILIVFVIPAQALFWDKSLDEYKSDFKNQIYELNEQKGKVAVELAETKKSIFTYKSLLEKSKKENFDFDNLLLKWRNSESEIYNLENKFKALVESADAYFNEIRLETNKIKDADLKSRILKKNKINM